MRGQIKFLEELDKAEQKRHEEQEREMLMRAAKSRSKTEDPEQAKLKAKVCAFSVIRMFENYVETNGETFMVNRQRKCNVLKWRNYDSVMPT